jgi:hypothetical protein
MKEERREGRSDYVAYEGDTSLHIRLLTTTLQKMVQRLISQLWRVRESPSLHSQRKDAIHIALAEQPHGREDRAEEHSRQFKPHLYKDWSLKEISKCTRVRFFDLAILINKGWVPQVQEPGAWAHTGGASPSKKPPHTYSESRTGFWCLFSTEIELPCSISAV